MKTMVRRRRAQTAGGLIKSSIHLERDLFEQIDTLARERGISRAAQIAFLLRQAVDTALRQAAA